MNGPVNPTDLARIQQWMQSVIMHPEGVEAGLASPDSRTILDVEPGEVEGVICRSSTQTSVERLHVYANAYYARLLEVMGAEYPALTHALGEELFQQFAFGYLRQHPSHSYTLNELGGRFPEYLAATRPPREPSDDDQASDEEPSDEKTNGDAPDWADFLIDLATLERTYGGLFDGPGVEGRRLLAPEDMERIKPETWPNVRLVAAPCLRLVSLRFAVHEYVTAVRRQEQPEMPAPSPTRLVLTRRDYVVRRTAVGAAEFAALATLVEGGTIAESLDAAATVWSGDFEMLAREVGRWFRDWAAAGYFLQVVSPDEKD